MDLHPEEGPNILSLFYSKARLNGKIPKPSLGRKYSGKKKKKGNVREISLLSKQDIALWTDDSAPFQPELQLPPTLTHLLSSIRPSFAHPKMPLIQHPSKTLHGLPGEPKSHRDRCRDKLCHQRKHFISFSWKEIP